MERRLGYILLLPAIITIVIVAVYPIFDVIRLSLTERFLTLGIDNFIGLDNYIKLIHDDRLLNALKNTIVFTTVSVSIELLLGLLIALFINNPFSGKGLIRASVLLPWAIPTVVSAKMWAWIFNTDFGILNYLLISAGIIGHKYNWLGEPHLAMFSAIMVDVWKTTPFAALLLLAGLQVIPDNLYKAASIDGAGSWQKCCHILSQ